MSTNQRYQHGHQRDIERLDDDVIHLLRFVHRAGRQ